jgi:hypothetical protein
MRWLPALLVLSACGRVAFDPLRLDAEGGTDDATTTADARTDGLLLYFAFDAAALLHDSASGRDATCASCPTAVGGPGPGSEAAHFDGTNCLYVPAADIQPSAFTFAAWELRDATTTATIFGRPTNGATGLENSFEIYTISGGSSVYVVASQSTLQADPGALGWHHIAGVFAGGTLTSYVDGVMANENTGIVPVVYGNDQVMIGCDIDAGSQRAEFAGSIDEVKLFDHALTAGEVAALAVP